MKKLTILITIIFITKLCVFAQTRNVVFTPLGEQVTDSWTIPEYLEPQDLLDLSDSITNYYPLASEVNPHSATTTYNCHAFAWHIVENGSPIVWIGHDPGITGEDIYWGDGSYIEVSGIIDGSKISYAGDHSAIVLSGTNCRSKWGAWPLVDHPVGYGPLM